MAAVMETPASRTLLHERGGDAADAAGAISGNDRLRQEGKTDQAVGKTKQAVQKAVGKVKKAVKKVTG